MVLDSENRVHKDSWSLRVAVSLWYTLLTAVIVAALGIYAYLQAEHGMIDQVDQSLRVASTQVLAGLDSENGHPAFQSNGRPGDAAYRLDMAGFAARIVNSDGTVVSGIGNVTMLPAGFPPHAGFITLRNASNADWRLFARPLSASFPGSGVWLEVAQALINVQSTLERFRALLLIAVPVVLVLIWFFGLLLADRTLSPIKRIVQSMYDVGTEELSTRLSYRKPPDEIGRIAQAFNHMLDRLERGFEREKQFTEDAAHELRTPLTVLRGQIEVALTRGRTEGEYRETLETLRGQVERLIRLTGDLLLLARLDSEKTLGRSERLNIDILLSELVQLMIPAANQKNIRIKFTSEDLPPISGNQDELVRLFMNLLDNAVKYNTTGGTIDMLAERPDLESQRIRVIIANSGPTIPAEVLSHVFDRFYRVDSGRSRETGGSGLGLSICAAIVHRMNGKIEMNSSSDRNEIIVTLPVNLNESQL